MENFEFHGPSTLDEAQAAMRAAEDGKFMAGGQSLLPVMKLELAAPSDVISLGAIDGLGGIEADGTTVTIGAAATHAEVHESEAVRQAIPALADLAGGIGDPQVRNRGTIGGSVAYADPAADYPAALVGLGATRRPKCIFEDAVSLSPYRTQSDLRRIFGTNNRATIFQRWCVVCKPSTERPLASSVYIYRWTIGRMSRP